MRSRAYFFGGTSITLVLSAFLYIFYTSERVPMVIAPTTIDAPLTTAVETATTVPEIKSDLRFELFSLKQNTDVMSPLILSGKARGMWFFEASFPVTLVDANGKTLAQTPAQAQGDWMTEEFVDWSATLTWTSTSTTATSGMLIFERDNPSGLPEHDESVEVPVTFQ